MKYQILRYSPAPEAFWFVRDEEYTRGVRNIRQWDSLEEAKQAVKDMLAFSSPDIEHVIVTTHLVLKHTTTYPVPEPIHEIREFTLDSISTREQPVTDDAVARIVDDQHEPTPRA